MSYTSTLPTASGTVLIPPNPMTTAGDIIYGGASGAPTRLAIGTADKKCFVNASGTAPEYAVGLKQGSFTRNMNAASGNVSYTGVGFKPSLMFAFYTNSTLPSMFVSMIDATGVNGMHIHFDGSFASGFDNGQMYIFEYGSSQTKYQTATLASFDSDGFTLSWTRSASTPASSTITVYYMAWR